MKTQAVVLALFLLLAGCTSNQQYYAAPSTEHPSQTSHPQQANTTPPAGQQNATAEAPKTMLDYYTLSQRWLPAGAIYPTVKTRPLPMWGNSMFPFIHDGDNANFAAVPASQIVVGDVVCWSLTEKQKASEEGVNMTQAAINMQLGLPTQVSISWWGAQPSGGVCHQVVWRNETRFLTQGTNPETNKAVDMLPAQSFSENYRGRLFFDAATQASLYQFWQANRQMLRYEFDGSVSIVWNWYESEIV